MPDSAATVTAWQTRFENILPGYLPAPADTPELLLKAMRYSATAGGKYIRPLLVYASGRALNLQPHTLDGIATAIELIHTYSLIHDDLPCMDDAHQRRGKRTNHLVHGEDIAILVDGDPNRRERDASEVASATSAVFRGLFGISEDWPED